MISLPPECNESLSFLLLLFLPAAALADGMVIPTIAYPAKITIPDQRALICFSNGTERLVIETRFTGSGTNFAWVVPLPSQPVIEEATTGLFPTLQYLFRPEIVHEVPQYWLGILITFGLIYLFRLLAKYESIVFALCHLIFILMFLAALLLPALSSAKRGGMESTSSEQNISILDRKLVGIFETTTISSHDAKALQAWLSENGYLRPDQCGTGYRQLCQRRLGVCSHEGPARQTGQRDQHASSALVHLQNRQAGLSRCA